MSVRPTAKRDRAGDAGALPVSPPLPPPLTRSSRSSWRSPRSSETTGLSCSWPSDASAPGILAGVAGLAPGGGAARTRRMVTPAPTAARSA